MVTIGASAEGSLTRALGLSSGSMPTASADDMIEWLQRVDFGTVDLRVGKGQGWEAQGMSPFLAAHIQVAFIGTSMRLGDSSSPADATLRALDRVNAVGVPVKVFASGNLDNDPQAFSIAAKQIEQLTTYSGRPVVVETHHGYASLTSLDALCRAFPCRLLLDVFGFYQLTGRLEDTSSTLRRWAIAGQVKGFAEDGGAHLPLRQLPPAGWQLLNHLPIQAPITIESRADTLDDDAAILKTWTRVRSNTGGDDSCIVRS